MLLRFFLLGTFCFHLTIREFNVMNSTKLVLKNWFHFNFFYFLLLLLLFAFGHFFCSQEDCVLFKMPGTLWEGRFLPSTSPIRDLPNSLCSHRSVVLLFPEGLCQGRTGITRILFRYLEDTAGAMPESPGQSPRAVAVLSRAGGKGWFSVRAAPEHELSRTLLLQHGLLHSRFSDKALVGATPALHKVSASGTKSCADP